MDLLHKLQGAAPSGQAWIFISKARFESIKAAKEQGVWREMMRPLSNSQHGLRAMVIRAAKTKPSLRVGDGKPSVSIHNFRGTAITHWSRVPPAQMTSKLAGHSNVQTTLHYYSAVTDDQI